MTSFPSDALNSPPEKKSQMAEEADILERSTKRFKDVVSVIPTDVSMVETPLVLSYKDTLMDSGESISMNFSTPFDYVDDLCDEEDADPKMPQIRLSRADKARMRAPWKLAIIVKTFGKSVGYNFLFPRVKAQWKPVGKMECIDLVEDYFVFRFSDESDFNRVFMGGPWFVAQCYLTMRRWEPMFSTINVTFTTTDIWA